MSHTEYAAAVTARIDGERLAARTLDLARIPSPTGDSDAVSARYAAMLREIGIDVTTDTRLPGGPNVRGVWHGGDGPTLSLVGHLDTIHAPHHAPMRDGDRVRGRGTDDMKGAMAAVIEALLALKEAAVPLAGRLIVAAHSLHEAPVGHMEGLQQFVADGIFGDAAIVAEGFPAQHQILAGKGQAIFEITITRPGEIVHENYAAGGTVNPLDVALVLGGRLRARHHALAAEGDLPLLGPETLFIGEIHGGDFYNRVPTEARIVGIRRFGPMRMWAEIEEEFAEIVGTTAAETGATITYTLAGNGLGYTVPDDAPVVAALAAAHAAVTGEPLPVAGTKSVTDANIIARSGIPALCYGPNGNTAHADDEYVAVSDLVRAARVYAETILRYPGMIRENEG